MKWSIQQQLEMHPLKIQCPIWMILPYFSDDVIVVVGIDVTVINVNCVKPYLSLPQLLDVYANYYEKAFDFQNQLKIFITIKEGYHIKRAYVEINRICII